MPEKWSHRIAPMVDKIDRPGANTRAVNSSPRSRSCWVLGFDMLLTDGSAVQLDLPGFDGTLGPRGISTAPYRPGFIQWLI